MIVLITQTLVLGIEPTTSGIASSQGHYPLDQKARVAAFACCLASLLNGILSMLGHRRSWSDGWMYTLRFFHYFTGIGSLFLATATLCYGFQTRSFIDWTERGEGCVLALVVANCIMTALVPTIAFPKRVSVRQAADYKGPPTLASFERRRRASVRAASTRRRRRGDATSTRRKESPAGRGYWAPTGRVPRSWIGERRTDMCGTGLPARTTPVKRDGDQLWLQPTGVLDLFQVAAAGEERVEVCREPDFGRRNCKVFFLLVLSLSVDAGSKCTDTAFGHGLGCGHRCHTVAPNEGLGPYGERGSCLHWLDRVEDNHCKNSSNPKFARDEGMYG
ncbi:unnamed protein product [Chrysodeixis includens]|uniref:Cytochrome b561 domain-containing protein n=1 Tax=Chrysodeixis includens TaxID=689277 RepID=A0A9N8KYP1_CHRIL|nr:unnamed protein product [Chrysodeixis includens]